MAIVQTPKSRSRHINEGLIILGRHPQKHAYITC